MASDGFVPYDLKYVPRPFALNNTGVICYFSTLLQCLASCPSVVKTVVESATYMSKTRTGAAFYNYMKAVQQSARDPKFVVDPRHSAVVLHALVQDLRERRPKFRFGGGMESALESLVFILDMIELPSEVAEAPKDADKVVCSADPKATKEQDLHPLLRLLHIRVRDRVCCMACNEADPKSKGLVSERLDAMYQYQFFHYDDYTIRDQKEFVDHMLKDFNRLPDFACDKCLAAGRLPRCEECRGRSAAADCSRCRETARAAGGSKCHRMYEMRRIPNVLVVSFNQYVRHRERFFPQKFEVEGAHGKKLIYQLVAVANHSGGLNGGHYWARTLRQEHGTPTPLPSTQNDSSVGWLPKDKGLPPSRDVYTVFYHYVETV